MLPILDNLPNEILRANLNALEDLSCVHDWADPLKVEEGRRMLTQDRLEVQLTESTVLNYALPYFRSLGEVEKNSTFFFV